MANARCTFQKPNGEGCRGFAIKDSVFCFVHSPQTKEAQRQAASKGGKTHAKQPTPVVEPAQMRNHGDLSQLLVEGVNGIRTGQMGWREANALVRLVLTQAKLWGVLR